MIAFRFNSPWLHRRKHHAALSLCCKIIIFDDASNFYCDCWMKLRAPTYSIFMDCLLCRCKKAFSISIAMSEFKIKMKNQLQLHCSSEFHGPSCAWKTSLHVLLTRLSNFARSSTKLKNWIRESFANKSSKAYECELWHITIHCCDSDFNQNLHWQFI